MINKVEMTRDISNVIKDERTKKGLTQKEISIQSNISLDKYKRIELCKIQFVDYETLKLITEILDINDNFWIPDEAKRTSIRIPNDVYSYLEKLKIENDFTSLTEALVFCVIEYRDNSELLSVKDSIEDIVISALNKSYIKVINALKKENKNYELIFEKASLLGIDLEKIKDEVIEEESKKKHANAY